MRWDMSELQCHATGSLSSARSANDYARRLIKLNPQFIDAYLTTGLSEYLIGSLPFYVRWFVHFDGVSGSKTQAIDNLQLVARSGRYLRPFVATGFIGAYTTYSTFAVETDLLIKNGHPALGLAYALASLGAGLGAVWAGIWVARLPGRGGGR